MNRSVNLFNEADFNEASLAEEESPKRWQLHASDRRRSEANKEVSAIRRDRNCGIRSNFTNFLFGAQYITARSKSPKVPPGQHGLALPHENNRLWYNVVVVFDN